MGSKKAFLGQEVHYHMVCIAYHTELNWQICNYMQKRRICREIVNMRLTKIFMAVFPLAERLPTSTTLSHWQNDSLLLLRLADLKILADEDTNSMPDERQFLSFCWWLCWCCWRRLPQVPNLFLPLSCDALIWLHFRWFKHSLPGSVVPLGALFLYNCSLRITRRRRKQRKSINFYSSLL